MKPILEYLYNRKGAIKSEKQYLIIWPIGDDFNYMKKYFMSISLLSGPSVFIMRSYLFKKEDAIQFVPLKDEETFIIIPKFYIKDVNDLTQQSIKDNAELIELYRKIKTQDYVTTKNYSAYSLKEFKQKFNIK